MSAKREKNSDDRVTIKIDRVLWKAISKQVEEHPEWGMSSVSDFIRRAVDRELEYRMMVREHKTLEIDLIPRKSREGIRDRAP